MRRSVKGHIRGAVLGLVALLAAGSAQAATSVLFIGNSFTFADKSAVIKYRGNTVTDLNGGGIGGVPALFKLFANEAGLDFDVSLETAPGKGLDYHLSDKRALIDKSWDHVVMHGYSTLDAAHPGDPALLVSTARQMADLLHARNPKVDILMTATWARPDQVYPAAGAWKGKTMADMTHDLRRAYDAAATGAGPLIRGVAPVGDAFQRAVDEKIADGNPYDGTAFEQLDLWSYDHYHASTAGYYLEALVVFGRLTGLDPAMLGKGETAAGELGLSPDQAAALQKVAHEELATVQSFAPMAPVAAARAVTP
ncbi:MAG: hypothetical protein JWM33_2357 [Caulobacteraceae bacterium]|nr:hypothetical protein [Caulobacteraceae bacterium]